MKAIYCYILTLFLVTQVFGQPKVLKYWVFFKDKGLIQSQAKQSLYKLQHVLPEKVIKRRAKVYNSGILVDHYDLPLYQPYIDQLDQMDIQIIVKSKWLNAISTELTEEQLQQLKKMSFVKSVKPVKIYKRPEKDTIIKNSNSSGQQSNHLQRDYGNSYTQNQLCHIPEIHAMGIYGSGILVGILDSGFKYDAHVALSQTNVIAEYDFINNDDVTENQTSNNDRSDQHNHGTEVLSVVGGYMEGELIGPAFKSDYILGKTETLRSETVVEEDYWVAGIEWMESKGADIVTSSVGYNDWYEYEDMDGDKAITTIAADIAVRKGVVVTTSMGNEGNKVWRYMTAPADGDSVISVGSVNPNMTLSSFSSRGPTYDGRIKPDVVAMGSRVYAVNPGSGYSYHLVDGTSYSTPIIAGVAALLLSAHPYLTPLQVRDALRKTANRANSPDNDYGWGLVNAESAIYYYGFFFNNEPGITNVDEGHRIETRLYTEDDIEQYSIFLYYSIENDVFIKIDSEQGTAENLFAGVIPEQIKGTKIKFYFSATDGKGVTKNHPYYAPDEYFTFYASDTTVNPGGGAEIPSSFTLYQNYPNPFNSRTRINYDLLEPGHVKLSIYNLNGQLVRTIIDAFQAQNSYFVFWDGRSNSGYKVSSGVYLYKLHAGSNVKIKKLVLLQ